MNRVDKAVEYKRNGYNCCQAVLAAFKDETNLDEEALMKIGAAFGVGMGCMEATCGALCGAQMLLGLLKYSGKPILRDAREVLVKFNETSGATKCSDLKGIQTGKVLCSCDDCVAHAAQIIEDMIQE